MPVYNYSSIREIAKEVRARLTEKGFFIDKTARRKPRNEEKIRLLYERALNRLERYRPMRRGNKIILPYFAKKG